MADLATLVEVIKYQLEYNKKLVGMMPAKKYDVDEIIKKLEPHSIQTSPPLPIPSVLAPAEEGGGEVNGLSDDEEIRSWKGSGNKSSTHEASFIYSGESLVGFVLEGKRFSLDQLNKFAKEDAKAIMDTQKVAKFDKSPPKSGDVGEFPEGTQLSEYKVVFLRNLTEHFSLYFSNTAQTKDVNGNVEKLIVSDYLFGTGPTFSADIPTVKRNLKNQLLDENKYHGVLLYPNYPRTK